MPGALLTLQAAAGNRAVGALLGAPPVQRYVMKVPPDPDPKAQQVVDKFRFYFIKRGGPGRGDGATDTGGALGTITSGEKLHVIAHGSTSTVGGMDPAAADLMVARGLPADCVGMVNLIACWSGPAGPGSWAATPPVSSPLLRPSSAR